MCGLSLARVINVKFPCSLTSFITSHLTSHVNPSHITSNFLVQWRAWEKSKSYLGLQATCTAVSPACSYFELARSSVNTGTLALDYWTRLLSTDLFSTDVMLVKVWFYSLLFFFVTQASRAQILNKATDYIQLMRRKNHTHQVQYIISAGYVQLVDVKAKQVHYCSDVWVAGYKREPCTTCIWLCEVFFN